MIPHYEMEPHDMKKARLRLLPSVEDMMLPPEPPDQRPRREYEYLVVTDKTSKILKSTTKYNEAVKLANLIRRGGGEVTIFKATRG